MNPHTVNSVCDDMVWNQRVCIEPIIPKFIFRFIVKQYDEKTRKNIEFIISYMIIYDMYFNRIKDQ